MSLLRIELFFDDEAGNWHYRVPALHINGGGTALHVATPSRTACPQSLSPWKATPRTTTPPLRLSLST